MRTRIIGDIHGKIYDYQIHCLKQGVRHSNDICPQRSIQVGDFGIGFNSEYWHDSVAECNDQILITALFAATMIIRNSVRRCLDILKMVIVKTMLCLLVVLGLLTSHTEHQ